MPRQHTSMRRRNFLKLSGVAGMGSLVGCIGDTGDGEYPSQDIRWVIPYSSGGQFDAYSRIVAEHMPTHLPGDVNVVAENVTGAGGRTGANEIYRADPDGYTVGLTNDPGFVVFQMLEETEYDMTEYSHIGRIAFDPHVFVVNPDSEFESLEDLQAADTVVFGAPGMSTNAALFAIIAGELLDFEVDFVTGFDGMAEVRTAVMREDVDAAMTVVTPTVPEIEDGNLEALIIFDTEGADYAPDAPTIGDLGHADLGEAFRLNWLCSGPPGMDPERHAIFEEAFLETLASDEVQTWAEETGSTIDPAGGDEARGMVEETHEVFGEFIDIIEAHQ